MKFYTSKQTEKKNEYNLLENIDDIFWLVRNENNHCTVQFYFKIIVVQYVFKNLYVYIRTYSVLNSEGKTTNFCCTYIKKLQVVK